MIPQTNGPASVSKNLILKNRRHDNFRSFSSAVFCQRPKILGLTFKDLRGGFGLDDHESGLEYVLNERLKVNTPILTNFRIFEKIEL